VAIPTVWSASSSLLPFGVGFDHDPNDPPSVVFCFHPTRSSLLTFPTHLVKLFWSGGLESVPRNLFSRPRLELNWVNQCRR
jgi:hypothetical protein